MKKKTTPSVKLNNGINMPLFGTGSTHNQGGIDVESLVLAFQNGVRLVDTAKRYGSERTIRRAVKEYRKRKRKDQDDDDDKIDHIDDEDESNREVKDREKRPEKPTKRRLSEPKPICTINPNVKKVSPKTKKAKSTSASKEK